MGLQIVSFAGNVSADITRERRFLHVSLQMSFEVVAVGELAPTNAHKWLLPGMGLLMPRQMT